MIPLLGNIQEISPAATGLPQSDQMGLEGPRSGAFGDYLSAESGPESPPDADSPVAEEPGGQGGNPVRHGGKELPGLPDAPATGEELNISAQTAATPVAETSTTLPSAEISQALAGPQLPLDQAPVPVAAFEEASLSVQHKHPLMGGSAVATSPTETAEIALTGIARAPSPVALNNVPLATDQPAIPPGEPSPPRGFPSPAIPPAVTPPGLAHAGMTPPGLNRPGMTPPGLIHAGVTPPGLARAGMTLPGTVDESTAATGQIEGTAPGKHFTGVPANDKALLPQALAEAASETAAKVSALQGGPEEAARHFNPGAERGAADATVLNRPGVAEVRAEAPLIEDPYAGPSEEKLLDSVLSQKSLDTVRPNQPPAAQAPPVAGGISMASGESPATDSVKPGVTASMTARMGDPGWNNELAGRVAVLFKNGMQEASMQLNPPELGRLDIRIRTEGDQATIQFAVQRPDAREAIENAMPQLRQMLEENGLQLARGEVADHSQSDQRENHGVHSPSAGDIADQEESGFESVREVAFMTPNSAVDYYV